MKTEDHVFESVSYWILKVFCNAGVDVQKLLIFYGDIGRYVLKAAADHAKLNSKICEISYLEYVQYQSQHKDISVLAKKKNLL